MILDASVINAIRSICADGMLASGMEIGKRLGVSSTTAYRLRREYNDKFGKLPSKHERTLGIQPQRQHLTFVTENKDTPESLIGAIKRGVKDASISYDDLYQLSVRYVESIKQRKALKRRKGVGHVGQ